MSKLSIQEEKELISFIKDWLKSHGFTQKDLANELNIKSSRTSEIILKIREIYKKGGMFNIAKNLIKIEQKWFNNIKNEYPETKQTPPYNQLDIDSLVNQINQDTSE
jgi:transcriptional regulator with XRE-family HTH domain